MKLVNAELEKRVVVKLDKSININGSKGIMTFGEKNDYPQIIERIVNSSVTAKASSDIYARFLTGSGFVSDINDIVIGKDQRSKEVTVIDLLRQVAASMAIYNGAYIHANLNLNREVVNAKLVPFKYCRFAKIDDSGYTSRIAVYENWDKDKDLKFEQRKIKWYDIFNLNEKVFAAQVKKAGSIDQYAGQIYFEFIDNQFLYPLSPYDPVYMDADTESQIQLFKNRQIRNGFFDKTVFRVENPADKKEADILKAGIKSFIGPDGDSVLILEDELDPTTGEIKKTGAFAIDSIKSNVNDKLFENWEKGLANTIRKANKALPSVLIDYDESKLGTTSGEGIIQATNYYNAMTKDDRKLVSKMFKEIFSNAKDVRLKNNQDWSIKELSLYQTQTNG